MPFATAWVKSEDIMLNEIRQGVNWEDVDPRVQTYRIRQISSGDLMYSLVTLINRTSLNT